MSGAGQPLVSVIIPLYNAERYIAECVTSVLEQTWPNIEVIIVDDGSTDDSLTVAKKFEGEHIKVLSQKNKGASAARNKGLSEAKGNYIQFLDADDLISNDKINNQVLALEEQPNKVAVCSTVHFPAHASHLDFSPSDYEEQFAISDDDPVRFLIRLMGGYSENGGMITIHSWLVPRAIINKTGPWNEELTVDDDGEYFTRVLLNSNGVVKTEGKNFYRKHKQGNINLSSLKDQKGVLSQVRSLQLKYAHISRFNQSLNLKTAYARSLSEIKFKLYPNGGAITSLIDKEIAALNINFKFQPIFGTKTGSLTARLFGWKLARLLQYLFK